MTGADVLVPVRESVTLRNTVAYAIARAVESAPESRSTVHFVYLLSQRVGPGESTDEADELLDRVATWAEEDLGENGDRVDVETAVVGRDGYLFNPGDYSAVLTRYADANDVDSVLLDPEFNPAGMTPLLPPLEAELERAGLDAEVAPVERPTRRFPVLRRAGLGQFVVLFGWAFGFYLLVGGTLSTFDLATGAISALVVASLLWRISLSGFVNVRQLVGRLARVALYAPFLFWEVTKANVQIAYVVLHPSLPIDPEVVEFDAAVWSELPVATLANSITLTPGTLTVDVTRQHFTVHALTTDAREDLLGGTLERAVRFVFYGRSAARLASPAERAPDAESTERAPGEPSTGDAPDATAGEAPDATPDESATDDPATEGDRA